MSTVPQITLKNGFKIPQLGLGTWKVSIEFFEVAVLFRYQS
jgi:diketogulonate reductase-like aldo/keto reductase